MPFAAFCYFGHYFGVSYSAHTADILAKGRVCAQCRTYAEPCSISLRVRDVRSTHAFTSWELGLNLNVSSFWFKEYLGNLSVLFKEVLPKYLLITIVPAGSWQGLAPIVLVMLMFAFTFHLFRQLLVCVMNPLNSTAQSKMKRRFRFSATFQKVFNIINILMPRCG